MRGPEKRKDTNKKEPILEAYHTITNSWRQLTTDSLRTKYEGRRRSRERSTKWCARNCLQNEKMRKYKNVQLKGNLFLPTIN